MTLVLTLGEKKMNVSSHNRLFFLLVNRPINSFNLNNLHWISHLINKNKLHLKLSNINGLALQAWVQCRRRVKYLGRTEQWRRAASNSILHLLIYYLHEVLGHMRKKLNFGSCSPMLHLCKCHSDHVPLNLRWIYSILCSRKLISNDNWTI